MNPGKECGYGKPQFVISRLSADTYQILTFISRSSSVVPLFRPEVPSILFTTHTDVPSTLLHIAGVNKDIDGTIIPLGDSAKFTDRHEHAAIGYWGAVSGSPLFDKSFLTMIGCPRGNLWSSK